MNMRYEYTDLFICFDVSKFLHLSFIFSLSSLLLLSIELYLYDCCDKQQVRAQQVPVAPMQQACTRRDKGKSMRARAAVRHNRRVNFRCYFVQDKISSVIERERASAVV